MLAPRHLAALPFAVILLAVALGFFFGGGKPNSAAPESFALENGMNVLVIPDHRAPVVTHMVWYKVGAADETPGKTGLAHFLEHLMFKGTEKIAPGEFSRIVARNGGQDNAFTHYDFTAYFQVIAKDRLPLVMEMEADRMTNLRLTDAEVLPERDVVMEERRMRIENNPVAALQSDMNEALYGAHPYGRDIIGYMDEIAGLGTADALDFYKRFYTPNNATLIVAGDVTVAELRPLAEQFYGGIAVQAPTFIRDRVPAVWPEDDKRLERRDPRVTQATWLRFYPAPSHRTASEADVAAFAVLAEILGGGTTSRLYRALVVDQRIASGVQSWYEGNRLDDGKFGIYALPQVGGDLPVLERAIEAEVQRLLTDGIDKEELERARTVIAASAVYARDNQRTMAYAYGEGLMTGLTVAQIHEWPDHVRRVTREDVARVARLVFENNPSVTGEMLPGGEP